MQFDKTVNLGHLLIMISMIVAAAGAWISIGLDLRDHKIRLITLEETSVYHRQTLGNLAEVLYKVQRDVAVIKDRSDRDEQSRRKIQRDDSH